MLRDIASYLLEGESQNSSFFLFSNKEIGSYEIMGNKPLEWFTCSHFVTNY